ncbi:MAG TPA: exosome complex RNA-binding protein Rrp4 [Candidatus Nanoarchaeia archaeon]|nr:exosome complex RNA-binding protein Rrp4 [Candidatus Nanoarchaeia archaeon]
MDSKMLVEDRDIVIPGEVLACGMDFLPGNGTYREQDKILASQLGLVSVNNRFVKVIALTGKYSAVEGDLVIGKVCDVTIGAWLVDIGGAYGAALALRETPEFIERGSDLTRYYDFGDIIIAKVVNVIKGKGVDLTMKGPGLRKANGGRILEVTPSKVPRIIGKQGSMISLIKEKTSCMIVVGQNGKVWIKGENTEDEVRAAEAVLKIEQESHVDGLTEKINELLSKGGKNDKQS